MGLCTSAGLPTLGAAALFSVCGALAVAEIRSGVLSTSDPESNVDPPTTIIVAQRDARADTPSSTGARASSETEGLLPAEVDQTSEQASGVSRQSR